MKWKVSREEAGCKLIQFLQTRISSSAKKIKNGIDRSKAKVNGRVERFATFIVGPGDEIEFSLPEEIIKKPLEILFEDSHLLILNKPPHIPSEKILTLQLVHRLDKETSGCLLFAKTDAALESLMGQFKDRSIKKEYYALVDGEPGLKGVIENQLGKLKSYQGQTLWGEVKKGLFAKTEWEKVWSNHTISLLKCYPETGRTHQIRIHLADIGHPILGDHTYGKRFKSAYEPPRILLHASKLTFIHPITGEMIRAEALLPQEFKDLM